MYTLLLLTVLAQPGEAPAAAGANPPEQVLARIDSKGNLIIIDVTPPAEGPAVQEQTVNVGDPKAKEKTAIKVETSSLTVTTVKMPARYVEAYSVDGKAISAETLATLLAKERTVLVAMDGKKLDPFYLQLYKEGTIILVPPANTLNLPGQYGGAIPVPTPGEKLPPPLPPVPPGGKN
jgi:hypothetical protein